MHPSAALRRCSFRSCSNDWVSLARLRARPSHKRAAPQWRNASRAGKPTSGSRSCPKSSRLRARPWSASCRQSSRTIRSTRLRSRRVPRRRLRRRHSSPRSSSPRRARPGAPPALSPRIGTRRRDDRRARVEDTRSRRGRRSTCYKGAGFRRRPAAVLGGNDMIRFALLALLSVLAPSIVAAQSYPSKPIHIILPYVPGGIIDTAGRHLALRLSESLGQSVVADNRPGAGGVVGTDVVARSAPDGYTILLNDPALVSNPSLLPDVPYELSALQPVSVVGSSPAVIVASPHLPVTSFSELVAYAKANPGKLNFASAGIGTAPHLAAEMIKLRTGISMQHVPYRGIGAAYPDVLSGKVQLAFSSIAGALPFTADNRVRPLATTGSARSSVYPDVPTVAESLPGFDVDLWIGIYAPAGLPPPVLAKLNDEINKVLQHPELKAAFAKIGVAPRGTSPEQAAAFTRSEYEKWKTVIVEGKIKPE